MSNIPKAREILADLHSALAGRLNAPAKEVRAHIKSALKLMTREPCVRRGREKAAKVTPVMAAQIRAYARANPHMLNREIGRAFNIDGGRVSEVLHGKR